MSYLGKEFVLDSQDKFAEFLETFGDHAPAEMRKLVVNHKGTAKLEKTADGYAFTTSQFTGGHKTTAFKNGVEFEDELAGIKAKVVMTMAGDTLTSVLKLDNGITFTIKRDFSDDKIVAHVSASSTDIVATRTYKLA